MTVDSKCSLSPSSSINRILCKLKILNNCIHEDHRGNPLWYNFLLKIIFKSTFYPDVISVISVTGVVLRKVSLIIVTTATLIVTERCLKTEINEISEVKRANYASARRQLWTTRAQLLMAPLAFESFQHWSSLSQGRGWSEVKCGPMRCLARLRGNYLRLNYPNYLPRCS